VLPALFFGIIYVLINGSGVLHFLFDKYKCGYWFTISLFEYFLLQYAFDRLAAFSGLEMKSAAYAVCLVALSFAAYGVAVNGVTGGLGALNGLIGLSQLRYYVFFVVGRLVRLHLANIVGWKSKEAVVALTVVVFLLLVVLNRGRYVYGLGGLLFHANLVVFELSATMLVFATLYRSRDYWSSGKQLPRCLAFMGRRTLDIYLLHYFFLPKDLHVFGSYFQCHPAPVLECAFGMAVSLAVVGVCLLCSAMLRSSRIVTRYVLGGK